MKRKSRVYDYDKPTVVIDWTLTSTSPAAARRAVATQWLAEAPYTRYRYNVEQCCDGSRVYLLRPTWLNKGFDFMVNLEGFQSQVKPSKGPTREMPSHRDIIHDLSLKVQAHPALTTPWFDALGAVYDCEEPQTVLARCKEIGSSYGVGLPADQLLCIVKWLFIEQDVTYWAQTGRDMLMAAIENDVFVHCFEDQ